jgi:acetyl-CoA synthetase
MRCCPSSGSTRRTRRSPRRREGEPVGERRDITYADLQREVVRFANTLTSLGVRRGTPVAIYLGTVPELPVAMLARTRLGAPHTVVFGGFSADSLSGRMNDMGCTVLITQDESWRRGKAVPLKATADEAMAAAPGVQTCLVVRRTGGDVSIVDGRDVWYHEASAQLSDDPESCPCAEMDAEDLLFLMYTSGTTARGPACSTRGRPTFPTRTGGGTSSSGTGSPCSTPRRRPFVPI